MQVSKLSQRNQNGNKVVSRFIVKINQRKNFEAHHVFVNEDELTMFHFESVGKCIDFVKMFNPEQTSLSMFRNGNRVTRTEIKSDSI